MTREAHSGTPGEDAWPNSRIDYIFLKGKGMRVTNFNLALKDNYEQEVRGWFSNEKTFLPLSDHQGVLATIKLASE